MRFEAIGLKAVGAVVVAVSLLMVFLIIWFLDAVSTMSQEYCTCGDTCEMVRFELPTLFYVGLLGVCHRYYAVCEGGSVIWRGPWPGRLV